MQLNDDSICAIATPQGVGAISIIRISGQDSIAICDKIFVSNKISKKLIDQKPFTIHYGRIEEDKTLIDDVLVSIFKSPNSFTGEDSVEISCHGSVFIQQKIIEALLKNGARLAKPGEFTMRAFMNGKMDLSQAEAVADVIASSSEASHKLAIHHLRGGISQELAKLRDKLLNLISLIELELDFSEEDVEFASRDDLRKVVVEIKAFLDKLGQSFKLGNAVKNGIPVAIIGQPNVGKSTLLNAILNEERAIVSDIPGTTRDALEDTINLDGYLFRFIDTAGLRQTTDVVETIGIKRTHEKIASASIVLFLFDINESISHIRRQIEGLGDKLKNKKVLIIINKMDLFDERIVNERFANIKDISDHKIIKISAKRRINLDILKNMLISKANVQQLDEFDVVLTNARHFEAINNALEAVARVENGMNENQHTDLIAQDIRQVLHYIGEITGHITTDEVLGNIFKNFCIGK